MSIIYLPTGELQDSNLGAGGRFMTYRGSRGDIEPEYWIEATPNGPNTGWVVSFTCLNYQEAEPVRVFVPHSVCRWKTSAIECAIRVLELSLPEPYRTTLSRI